MRLRFLPLLILLLSFIGYGQDFSFDLLQNQTETQILYNRVYPVSKATQLKTESTSSVYYRQVFSEMSRSDFEQRLPGSVYLKEQANLGIVEDVVPLSILTADFENIPAVAFDTGKINKNQFGKFELNADATGVFEKHQIGIMGALLKRVETKNPLMVLKSNLIFNLSNRTVSSIEIFNQNSWHQIIEDVPFQFNFNQTGKQKVKYRINYSDGESVTQSFEIEVRNKNRINTSKNNEVFGTEGIQNITSSIAYQGYDESQAYQGQAEFEVFLDTVDGVLDRPVILVDGFDPGDNRDIDELYDMLNFGNSNENLADDLRAQGYDVVLLNFPVYVRPGTSTVIDGGSDYIQRNAMILVELIDQINQQKVGNKQNVVIGPSMGGLISRYALRYMEMNNMDHDTRLYISFDSPHLGANVPIGFQHLFNFLAYSSLIGNESMQDIVDGMLRSPSAREMLLDHLDGHLQSGSNTEFNSNITLPTGAPGFRNAFQTEIDNMGFPEQTRNVAISNGAGNGTSNGQPGMTVLDHTFNISSSQRAIIKLNFTPAAGQTAEVSNIKGQQKIVIWLTLISSAAQSQSPSYTNGIDSSPGGRFDIVGLAESAGDDDMINEFLDNLQIGYFSFIPALSSMAITQTQNYYANISSGLNTPFENFYIPTQNQNHVFLEEGNVQFALDEILIPEWDCPVQEANFGDPCDDGNSDTENDVITEDCGCAGTISPNIWENGAWSKGTPVNVNSGRKLIFRSDFTSVAGVMSNGSGSGNSNKFGRIWGTSAEVEAGVNVIFNPNHGMILDGGLTVDSDNGASLTLKSGAFLSQADDEAVNHGVVFVERDFNMSEGRVQYNLLSSPVVDFNIRNVYSGQPFVFRYNEKNDVYINDGEGVYITGKGFRVEEADTGNGTGAATETGVFIGVPFNGEAMYQTKFVGNGYNLVGNPYASPLDLNKLYSKNTKLLSGTFYFWDNRGYLGTLEDIENHNAVYNVITNTGIAAPGPANEGFDERIPTNEVAVGTGFFVENIKGGKLKLNNSMRKKTELEGVEFFGKSKGNDRYWLTLTTPQNIQAMTAVVYTENGFNGLGNEDSQSMNHSDILYTLTDDVQLVIQGRAAFEKTDLVNLGFKATTNGIHTIGLIKQEGVFEDGQQIYLRDKENGVVTNLSQQNYSFTANAGEYNNRFEIIYSNFELNSNVLSQNEINIEKKNHNIVITSMSEDISAVEIFNLNGAPVYSKSGINQQQFSVPVNLVGNQIVVVKVKTVNGKIVNKKFINQR